VETPWIHRYIRRPPAFRTLGRRPIWSNLIYLHSYLARDSNVAFADNFLQQDRMLKTASNCSMISGCLSSRSISPPPQKKKKKKKKEKKEEKKERKWLLQRGWGF
jgi:hypothetical protein